MTNFFSPHSHSLYFPLDPKLAQIYVAEHFMDVRDNENNLNLLKNVSSQVVFPFLLLMTLVIENVM